MIDEIDVKTLWHELDLYEDELNKETKTLEEVWSKISDLKNKNEAEAAK